MSNLTIFSKKWICQIYLITISCLVSFNLLISNFVRFNDIFYIPNSSPNIFYFGRVVGTGVIFFIIWSLRHSKIAFKHPIPSILVLSGAFSNFIEFFLFANNIADYIPLGFGYFNIPDIQIWTGLIVLNLEIWILDDLQELNTAPIQLEKIKR